MIVTDSIVSKVLYGCVFLYNFCISNYSKQLTSLYIRQWYVILNFTRR